MKNLIVGLLVCVISLFTFSEIDARGRRGGFRSGGGSFRSSSSKSTRSSGGWGSKSSSRPKTTTPSKTSVQQKKYAAAKSSGKAFQSKSAAIKDFKSRAKTDPKIKSSLNNKYPTTFDSQPSTRPSYIPERYNGQEVVYRNGGYGYTDNSGAWTMLAGYMLIDTMSDAALMSSMNSNGYYVGPKPQVSFGWTGFIIFLISVVIIIILLILIANEI